VAVWLETTYILQRQHMIAEIVGPAGAGKSTITSALSGYLPIQLDHSLRWRELVPLYYPRVLSSLPLYLCKYRNKGNSFWPAVRRMAYFDKLCSKLIRKQQSKSLVCLLDQGPIYHLAHIIRFYSAVVDDQAFERWWAHAFSVCATTIDYIFWVDAPDDVLLKRIHTRNKQHRVRECSELEARKFLDSYRETYMQVIQRMTTSGSPRIIHYATDTVPLKSIVNDMLCTLRNSSGS